MPFFLPLIEKLSIFFVVFEKMHIFAPKLIIIGWLWKKTLENYN